VISVSRRKEERGACFLLGNGKDKSSSDLVFLWARFWFMSKRGHSVYQGRKATGRREEHYFLVRIRLVRLFHVMGMGFKWGKQYLSWKKKRREVRALGKDLYCRFKRALSCGWKSIICDNYGVSLMKD